MSESNKISRDELIKIEIDTTNRYSDENGESYGYPKKANEAVYATRNISRDIAQNMQKFMDQGTGQGALKFNNFINFIRDRHKIYYEQSQYSSAKIGNVDIKLIVMIAFCKYLNISFDELLGWDVQREGGISNTYDDFRQEWHWDEEYTKKVEETANEVWIITPDFYYDINSAYGVVKNNIINRGCKYKYIYKKNKDTDRIVDRMLNEYQQAFENAEKKIEYLVEFLPVPENKFFWISEMIIFNPNKSEEIEKAILVDVNGIGRVNVKQKINIELSIKDRWNLKDMFEKYWNQPSSRKIIKK